MSTARRTSGQFPPPNVADVSPFSRVAFHEAGHAVLSVLAHRALKAPEMEAVTSVELNIAPGDTLAGENRILGICHAPPIREMLEREIESQLAGGLAEAIHRGKRTRRGAWTVARSSCGMRLDLQFVSRLIVALRSWDDYRDQDNAEIHRRFAGRAWELLRANWSAVEAVAQALMERRKLEGIEIETLIDQSAPAGAPAIQTED